MNWKEIIIAIKHLYLFKKGYTFYPRWLEISLGVLSWLTWVFLICLGCFAFYVGNV